MIKAMISVSVFYHLIDLSTSPFMKVEFTEHYACIVDGKLHISQGINNIYLFMSSRLINSFAGI